MFGRICKVFACALLPAFGCATAMLGAAIHKYADVQLLRASNFLQQPHIHGAKWSFEPHPFQLINKLEDQELRIAFSSLAGGKKFMDSREFSGVLGRLGLGIHAFEIRDIFLEMDQDHDGRISFEVIFTSVKTPPTLMI